MNRQELIALLRNPFELDWRAHGIGFIKAYLDAEKTQRINIYHKMFMVPNISVHHDHPWMLRSEILAGELTNKRYDRSYPADEGATCFMEGVITCNDFRGLEGTPKKVWLHGMRPEVYVAGSRYSQLPEEIHETSAIDGTVTLMTRSNFTADGTARIFWPANSEWVDASRGLDAGEVGARGERPGEIVQAANAALRQLGEY